MWDFDFLTMIAIKSKSGNIIPASIPGFILPDKSDTKPTTDGPAEQPISPATAKRANIAVPPPFIPDAPVLSDPGHITPTENPQKAKPINDKTALLEKTVIR